MCRNGADADCDFATWAPALRVIGFLATRILGDEKEEKEEIKQTPACLIVLRSRQEPRWP